jgi:hypothetical protein
VCARGKTRENTERKTRVPNGKAERREEERKKDEWRRKDNEKKINLSDTKKEK